MTAATVTIRDGDGHLLVRTPYSAEFVAELKASIPCWARRWNPATKVWDVESLYKAAVLRLCRTYFGDVFIDDPRERRQTQNSKNVDWAAAMFKSVPTRLHKPIYLALVEFLHPDRADGDPAAMKALTAAYGTRDAA